MIGRYDCPEISKIWSDHGRFTAYLQVELALIKSLENQGKVQAGTAEKIQAQVEIRPQRIEEIEAVTHHDVIAFCTSITEQIDPELSRFFHFGATSSDIIDTATVLMIKGSLDQIMPALDNVITSLEKLVGKTERILCIGRSHGIWAEPMVFAQKWLGFLAEFKRRKVDLDRFYTEELTAQFSGAVGNYTILDHDIERIAASDLGLAVESVSTQVIPRDRLAKLTGIFSLFAAAVERIAVEVRHLQHSDIAEAAEGFKKGQKGSSTMPHKKNPVSSENLTGMSRLIRSFHSVALDNCVLWHERDISHSSNERMYLPDMFGLVFYTFKRLASTLEGLVFFEERIEAKVHQHTQWMSSYYLHRLLEQTSARREQLYEKVQAAAFRSDQKNTTLRSELISENPDWDFLPEFNFESIKEHYICQFQQTKNKVFQSYSSDQLKEGPSSLPLN